MVRETRHLWVGNLPENIREDRIREHFKRYGRVQSVKLLPRLKEEDGSTGMCATVAFMDIKSASKAHNMEHKLDERCLSTEYYEPAAIPGGSAAPLYVAPRFPHGPPEDHASFERSSHFYERREGDGYLRRPTSAYHVTDPLRGRTRDRLYRNGPYTPLIERAQPTHHRALGNAWSYDGTTSGRYPTTTPTPDPYPEERRETQPVVHKKRPKSSRSGSESGSNSGSSRSRSRSRSRSHSSSSSSQSGSSSCSSGTSSPGTDKSCSPHSSSHHGTARSGRVGGVALQSAVSAPHANNVSPAVQSEDRRPLAICVRNLPIRSSDTSLKDGLFHEYKKHGKVTWVKVVGQAGDRYALVCFKKPDDVDKALEESHNKLFFGCKIEVAPYTGYDVEDNEFRPYEAELDEFHPKATRTLFIGNLEKDITASELRKHFEQFGEIIEIDIKKQGVSSYAFCQYADIASVVKAIRTMDGEHLGSNRIKLGFGKSMATNCVWVDGIADTAEKYLNMQFSQYGSITHMTVDRERGHALIYFEQIPYAQDAVREMRGVLLRNRKLQVDFASRECQEAFYEHLEKQGQAVGGERPWERYDSNSREVQAGRFETTVVVPGARFTRYDTQPRPRATSYNRTANCSTSALVTASVGATVGQSRAAGRTQRTAQRYEYYDAEYPDRRYRNYDEFSQGSAASHDDSYEQELRDYGYCQRERGDSSPSPGACEGESSSMRRSVAVVAARPAKSCSPGDKVPCSEDDPAYKRHSLQSVVVSSDVATPSQLAPPGSAVPVHPLDIRHLQKERVHIQNLLEQLESSGDDDGSMSTSAPKKRLKLASDDCGEPPPSLPMCGVGPSGLDVCYENHSDVGAPSLVVTTHNHRKSVSEVRRLSDVSSKHCSRRLSTDSASKHGSSAREVRETSADRLVSVQSYSPHPVCKRRKTGSSTSESEDRVSCRSGKHSHHHHHHQHGEPASNTLTISGGESIDGSRPGTPLCDERPENLLPPTEPRRFPRDRLATEGPLSLPLPRFAAQVLSSAPRLPVSVSATKAASVSSPPAVHQPPPSPGPAPPPSSPPPRPPSLPSSSSSDSELSPPSPTLEERIRSLDEKYEKWSGSRALSAAGGDALAKLDASASERFRFRHKLLDLDLTELPPSDIVKSVLAKRSVFDEDSKRLENFSDKYEPREFVPYTRTTGCFQSLRIMTECKDYACATPTKPLPVAGTPTTPGITGKVGSFPNPGTPQLPSRLMGTPSPLHSPSHTPTTPTPLKSHVSLSPVGITPLHPPCGSKQQTLPKTPSTGLPAAAKGLQYPFPSHPPVLPTTTVATTTATTAAALVSVSSAGVKPSLSVTVPTSATGTVLSPEVTRTCVTKPIGPLTNTTSYSAEASRSSMPRPSVTVLTTATGTKPTPEVTTRVPSKLISSAPTPSSSSSVLLRLQPCVKPSTAPALPDAEAARTSVGEVSRFQSPTTCTTTRVSSATALVTPKVSCTSTSRSSVTTSKLISTSPTKLSKPSSAPQSNNIPPSACSPRVVIVPVSVSSSGVSTVTTAVASSTATTTVLTMTMASTIPTTTTFTTSTTTPTTNSSSETTRSTTKPKLCVASKKEQASQPQLCAKDKQLTSVKKESLPVFTSNMTNISKKDNNKESDVRTGNTHKMKADEKRKDSVGSVCSRRDSDESVEKEKRRDSTESIERDRRKDVDAEKEKRKDSVDSSEKDRRKEECADNLDRRKDGLETNDKERWKEGHVENLEKEENQDKERRKENHMTEKECESMDNAEKRNKERRKERGSSSGSPASIGCKRRMSSQDSVDSVPDDAKRLKLEHRKIGERRDSKDSGRSSSSSKRSSSERPRSHDNKNFAKLLEDKIREDTKHQQGKDEAEQQRKKELCEKHKTKDKQKKKNKVDRESPKEVREFAVKPTKEPVLEKESSPKSCKKKEDSDTEEKHKHGKREAKDKKKQMKEEFGSSEFLDEKARGTKKDRDKRNSSERRKDDEQKLTLQKKEGKKKEFSNSDSDSDDGGSGDGPKKHSIFDIVDDGPAYISMYDKVKARSTKNMQKQEEERRQEKMREKFNLLKQSREQSRAKREEKKRSTSWDEDSDSDNERGSKCKRHVKLMISSSSEDDGRTRYDGDEPKLNKSRPIVRIKKEDICGDSDSEFHSRASGTTSRPLVKQDGSEDDDSSARTKHIAASGKKGNRTKLVSDTSEDDSVARFKPNAHKMMDAYSADSDADQGFADSDDKLPTSKKSTTKNNRMGKGSLDSSNDESNRKLISDASKTSIDKQPSAKKTGNKNKFNKNVLDSSDDEYNRKFMCDKSETYPEEKLAGLKKALVKNRTPRDSLDSSEDENARKLADVLKADVYGSEKQSNLKKSGVKNKSKISVDSSDDENERKLPTTPKSDIFGEEKQNLFRKSVLKNKTAKNFPDLNTDDSGKKFLSDTEKSDMFGESLQAEKSSDCEVSASTPPPQLDKKPSFHGNSIEKGEDAPRKKSSKKKHKRQKNSQSSEDGLTKMGSTESDILVDKPDDEEGKPKGDGERKKHKRERRKSTHGKGGDSEDGKQTKVKKKKGTKPELGTLKAESSLKREEKMEDIFGPLSDDSEGGHTKNITPSNGGTGRMFEKLPKWQVSMVYASDSDSNASRGMDCYTPATALMSRPLEKERKRREKKKRDKKASSVELVEAGRALEAKLLSSDDYPEQSIPKAFLTSGKIEKSEDDAVKEEDGNNEPDVFRFTDGDESLEAATAMLLEKAKEKKKKRKKSKEEKQNRREHHHHHHHDKSLSKSSPERKLSVSSSMEDSKPSPLLSPSLPSLDMPASPVVSKPDDALSLLPSQQETVIPVSSAKSNEKKKPDKFIPGFGTEIDDKIHETAVKSISEFEAPKPKVDLHVKEESGIKVEQGLTKSEDDGQEEEKPRAVISQEETEDAVAALLGESFGADFTSSECYVGDGNGSPHATAHIAPEPALPTDEEEETRKAIEAIDMKPDTPQSEPDLQIDTDTDGDPEPPSYSGIRFSGDDQSPHTPDGIDFSRPPKTPDLPASYYNRQQQQQQPQPQQQQHQQQQQQQQQQQPQPQPQSQPQQQQQPEPQPQPQQQQPQQSSKSFEQDSVLVKPEPSVPKQMLPEEKPAEPLDKHTTETEKQDCGDQPKVESEAEPESISSNDISESLDNHQEEEVVILPKILVTDESGEPAKEDVPEHPFEHKEDLEEKETSDIGLLPTKQEEGEDNQTDNGVKVEEVLEVSTPVISKIEPKSEPEFTEIPEPNQADPPPCDRPKLSPPPSLISISTEPQITAVKEVDVLVKEEPKVDDTQDFGQYTFNKDVNKEVNSFDKEMSSKEVHAVPPGNLECKPKDSDIRLDRGYISAPKEDSGFVSVIKEEHPSDIARESDFSEPETDMKADDIVASLLASASMNQALNADDNSRPALETDVDRPYSPFKEREVEVVSVIKETDHRFKEEEQDPFASPIPESPTSKDDFEALAIHKGNKNDLSDVIKADCDYWSAKEVNIESVIKKVDALCSDDEMGHLRDLVKSEIVNDGDRKVWFDHFKEKPMEPIAPEEIKKEPEPEPELELELIVETPAKDVPLKVEVVEPAKEEGKDSGELKEKEQEVVQEEQQQQHTEKTPSKEEEEEEEEEDEEVETEADTSVEKDEQVVTEEESPVSGPATPRSTVRGGRGGPRSKAPTRISGVTTRRSRLAGNQKPSIENVTIAPVSPRRGGRRRGGSGNRCSVQDHSVSPANKKLTTDVYEFRDDSEDESSSNSGEKGRPRLILTIKSPQASGKEMQAKTIPPPVPVVETREEFPSPATTTRKSRRLQERDGSRTTVDDVIDDVVRSSGKITRSTTAAATAAPSVSLGLRPRRSTRQNISAQKTVAIVIPETPRKSPRGGKKQQAQQRRLSEALDESGDDKKKDEDLGKIKAEESPEPEKDNTECSPVKSPESPVKKKLQEPETSATSSKEEDNGEPTTLIDPVTGLLIPMRESEEGQYIPVTTAPVIIPVSSAPQVSTESQLLPSVEPDIDKGRARAQSLPPPPPEATPVTSASPQTHVTVISNTVMKPQPIISVATPVVPTTRQVGTTKTGVETITCGTVTKPVPQSLKAHVLQQAVKTVPSPPATVLPPPIPTALPQSPAVKVHTVPQPPVKTTVATIPHPKVRDVVLHQASPSVGKNLPMNPKAHLLQAVAGGVGPMVVVAPPPVVSKIHHAPPQPVNMKTTSPAAHTPKAHLLQAASGGPPKGGNFVPQQKPAPQPPKAHHGPSQQPILTGAVASPPLKAPHLSSQQPIGASSSRATVPKPQVPSLSGPHLSQHGKGLMDPPKVEVSIGGCIVVPTASPQSRNQVLQDCRTAGLPVPYETQIGEVAQHVSFSHHMRNPPHDMPQHYVHPMMYHPYLRAHQDALTAHIPHYLTQGAVRSPMVPGLEVKSEPESEEARGSSPPLELRRPSSNGAVTRGGGTVAHSLQSPHDRTTDSPQVATVYVHPGSRLTHYTTAQQLPPRYYEPGAEPPPAHLRTPRHHHHPLPGSEAPPTQPRLQVATPPHASQVPPQADSLLMLLQRYPVMWQGLLALKNDQAAVQMHFVFGNPHVARESLPCNSDGSTPPLRIAQRMRLEQTQVEGVARKMQIDNEHCMLLALPCGRDHMDVLQQSNNLQTGFITYLQQKQAAGIVNIAVPGSQQAAYVVHIFPSCDFANENLARIAPDLLHRVADIAHLLIIIATV